MIVGFQRDLLVEDTVIFDHERRSEVIFEGGVLSERDESSFAINLHAKSILHIPVAILSRMGDAFEHRLQSAAKMSRSSEILEQRLQSISLSNVQHAALAISAINETLTHTCIRLDFNYLHPPGRGSGCS